ncbi:AMP-binding protein [Aeromicrobium sp.]|uniref:AMP-binding protein n=1 Tax=Aeromicrobium sp. TaxID=1871063 RepID=UPI002FCBE3AC
MTSGLRPVEGSPREVFALVDAWVREGGAPIVVRTSGSTGEPKDVVLSHRAVLASARASLDRLGGPGGWLQAMPVTGVGGLQVLVRSAVAGLEPVYADEYASLGAAVAAIPGQRRYASLVPTQAHRLVESGEVGVLAGLDAVLIGGAAVPSDLLETLRSAGARVVRTYGMSETCGGCVYDGLPLDGVRVRVDEAGQVHLAGPVLFDGYADAEATARVLRDGWFATADLGSIDEDGRLHITGRIDDVVISGGVNVPTPAVAARLREHPAVSAAEVVGVPDDEWGHRVVAFVVGRLDLETARAWVAERHPRSWAPRDVVVLDALPLLGNGKVDRMHLKELA